MGSHQDAASGVPNSVPIFGVRYEQSSGRVRVSLVPMKPQEDRAFRR